MEIHYYSELVLNYTNRVRVILKACFTEAMISSTFHGYAAVRFCENRSKNPKLFWASSKLHRKGPNQFRLLASHKLRCPLCLMIRPTVIVN